MKFDGVEFAQKITDQLKGRLGGKKIVSFFDGTNPESVRYTRIKQKKAQELGVEFAALKANQVNQLIELIEKYNSDEGVNGIMVQLPIRLQDSGFRTQNILNLIAPNKDVDGLRDDSPFKPAVVEAVLSILEEAVARGKLRKDASLAVVGSKGKVGASLMRELAGGSYQFAVEGFDKDNFDKGVLMAAEGIISCTGQAELVTKGMVKKGFAAIDVGYPAAEFSQEALQTAGFYTPVPGGVGPITVVKLFENLLKV